MGEQRAAALGSKLMDATLDTHSRVRSLVWLHGKTSISVMFSDSWFGYFSLQYNENVCLPNHLGIYKLCAAQICSRLFNLFCLSE